MEWFENRDLITIVVSNAHISYHQWEKVAKTQLFNSHHLLKLCGQTLTFERI